MRSPSRIGIRLSLAIAVLSILLVGGWAWLVRSATAQTKEDARSLRPAWTTSRVVGSPEPPPPYKIVRAFPNLKFNHPLLMARCPGSDRLYVGEQAGVIHSFADSQDAKAELFFDLRKEIKTIGLLPGAKKVEAVYGLAFHPDFEKNRSCFLCYTLEGARGGGNKNFADGSRVSRFKVTKTDPPRIDPASEEILLTFPQGGHNGGDIHFGPDGMLYISTGDGGVPNPPDGNETGQDITDLLSSILRIDVDHPAAGKPYGIPKDNPFLAIKGARPEVWAYGLRNPWRMSFDTKTGELFVGDVGWELWESIHRVEKGGNYGWAAMEGPQPIKPQKLGPTPIRAPLIALPHTIACSVTGGRVYYGKKFPELYGAYIFGDWETRRMWAARFDGDRLKEMPELTRPLVRIVAFGEDKNGELYFLDYDGGTVHTIAKNDASARNADFPTKLSQTGLFVSVKDHTPAPGVVPFAVNSPQWHDGATEEHWVAIPGQSAVSYYPSGKAIPGMVDWHSFRMHFPKDSVLMRTLTLGSRRLETQLMHYDGLDWRAYTFAWRDDQTDADLVPADGAEKEIDDPAPLAQPAKGGTPKRVWQFHSRSQCLSCHTNQSEYALAFLPEQLNCPGPDGKNQLVSLTEKGVIRRVGNGDKAMPPFDAATAAKEKKMANPADSTQPIEARARAYLHANCGHCHSDHGGGSVPLRLQYSTRPADMKAIGVRPVRGDFGIPDACIIKPGDPYASTLYYRMSKFGRDRMPHIGAERPDEEGLKLIESWITSLGSAKTPDLVGPPAKVLADPKSAMQVARLLGRGMLNSGGRDALLSEAAKLPAGPIRDLFDGYLPQTGERKLGSNPRPKIILALQGNADRGAKMFWSKALNCGSCHKVGNQGTPLGPDLSAIGKLRTRDDLLESILEPSRRIEPQFAAYVVVTTDGRSLTGLLVARDANKLVLRDAQNKEVTLSASDVEVVQPSRQSLMPDGQLGGLTPQEAADVLEYLATRK